MKLFDIDQLKTFVAVVDAGSLTAGAAHVFLSQSAVSEQVRKLEERAGQPLLLRAKSGVATTVAGDRLLAHARRLLALSEEAWRDLHGERLQGDLQLAVTDYFRPRELSGLLARLAQQHPQVRLHVSVLKSGAIEAGYARGEFDVGLSMRLVAVGSAALARGSQTLRKESLRWMAAPSAVPVRGQPLRLLVLPDTCLLHQFTVKLLTQRKLPFDVRHVASGVAGLQSALAAGLGVACLNESSIAPGFGPLGNASGLPALPAASFYLLPARSGESPLVSAIRQLLAAQFTAA